MFGQRLGAFVPPKDVVNVVVGITEVFRDWGYRRARNRARLKFLMRDWGPEKFREMLEKQIGFALANLDEPAASTEAGSEHLGVWPQKDGNNYIGFAPKAGRISGHQLRRLAALAAERGGGRLRTTTQQKMAILDVPEANVETLVQELELLDLPGRPGKWRAGTMACTGIEFCKLAIVETKGRAVELYRYLEKRLPGYEDDIRINVNGCPNSCARYQTADIGLMGCQIHERVWVTDHDGEQIEERRKVEAFLVHLGGHLGENRAFGRKVRGVKVPASEIGPYVETLVLRFRSQRNEGENFAAFIARLSNDELKAFGAKPNFPQAPPAPTVIAEARV